MSAPRQVNGKRTPEYGAWRGINVACGYMAGARPEVLKRYRDRGITICKEWQAPHGYEAFYNHIGPKPSPKLVLDRKNNDKGYEPGNVRWVTITESNRNKSPGGCHKPYSYGNLVLSLCAWQDKTGIHSSIFQYRLKQGYTFEQILRMYGYV